MSADLLTNQCKSNKNSTFSNGKIDSKGHIVCVSVFEGFCLACAITYSVYTGKKINIKNTRPNFELALTLHENIPL